MKEVYELTAYKLSEDLSDLIWYALMNGQKSSANYGVSDYSISKRDSGESCRGFWSLYPPADRKIFYRYSRGSFEETKAWLRKPIRRQIISNKEISKYTELSKN